MHRYTKLMITLVVLYTIVEAAKFVLGGYRKDSNGKFTEEQKQYIVSTFNEKAPHRIDENSAITEMEVDDNILRYMITLGGYDFNSTDIKKLGDNLRIYNLFKVCDSMNFESLFSSGFDVSFRYSSPKGELLFDNKISKNDCSPFRAKDVSVLGDYYVSLIRKIIPLELESEIVLTDIKRDNFVIETTYELKNSLKDDLVLEVVRESIITSTIEALCSTLDTRHLFDKGFSVKDIYVDRVGDFVLSFEITEDMCENH